MTPPDEPSGESWASRLRRQLAERQARLDRRDALRADHAERRQHGLAARHQEKLGRTPRQRNLANHNTPEMPMNTTTAVASPERKQRCRLLHQNKRGALDRCANEVADEAGEIALCVAHLGDAMRLLNRRAANTVRQPHRAQPED